MKDLYSIELPALGDTSCSIKVGGCTDCLLAGCDAAGSPRMLLQQGGAWAALCHWGHTRCWAVHAVGSARSASPPCRLAAHGPSTPPNPRPCSLLPQTFLLPFDPEDHEDADEWREYTGELSSKELQKVGGGRGEAAGRGDVCGVSGQAERRRPLQGRGAHPATVAPLVRRSRQLPALPPPQAALELFPAAGISPVTADTHRQWLGSEPQRVKVGGGVGG